MKFNISEKMSKTLKT